MLLHSRCSSVLSTGPFSHKLLTQYCGQYCEPSLKKISFYLDVVQRALTSLPLLYFWTPSRNFYETLFFLDLSYSKCFDFGFGKPLCHKKLRGNCPFQANKRASQSLNLGLHMSHLGLHLGLDLGAPFFHRGFP